MTDKGVRIVYRNHEGLVKEYFIIPLEKTMRFDYPWEGKAGDAATEKSWIFDAIVVRNPDNVTRTFNMAKILEWKKG